MTFRLTLLLCVVSVACGMAPPTGTGGGGGGAAGGAGGGGGASALQCESYGWCTTMESDSTPLSSPPALVGGTITDGIYREEQGWEGRSSFIFRGNSVLIPDGQWGNQAGTWFTLGNTVTMTATRLCNTTTERDGGQTLKYEYFVQGDELFLSYVSQPKNLPVQRFKKVASLCAPSADFKCRSGGACTCVATENESFRGRASCL
jgi:hypothetical protein